MCPPGDGLFHPPQSLTTTTGSLRCKKKALISSYGPAAHCLQAFINLNPVLILLHNSKFSATRWGPRGAAELPPGEVLPADVRVWSEMHMAEMAITVTVLRAANLALNGSSCVASHPISSLRHTCS